MKTKKGETMHQSFLHLSQVPPPPSSARNFDPITPPFPLHQIPTHNLPQLAPGQPVVSSHHFLGDHHLADERARMLLDSLSEEEAARLEEGNFFLPFDWLYPEKVDELQAYTLEEWNEMMAGNDPASPGAFAVFANSLAEMRPSPLMNPMELSVEHQSDEFMMFKYKVYRCSKKFNHDWASCPYAHEGEKFAKRDPLKYTYLGEICEEFRQTGRCCFREYCRSAHGIFEFWLHPTRYRTNMCDRGTRCHRMFCFFAHKPEEKRPGVHYDEDLFKSGAAYHPSSSWASYGSESPFNYGEGCSKGAKQDFSAGENKKMRQSDFPEMTIEIIRELGIL